MRRTLLWLAVLLLLFAGASNAARIGDYKIMGRDSLGQLAIPGAAFADTSMLRDSLRAAEARRAALQTRTLDSLLAVEVRRAALQTQTLDSLLAAVARNALKTALRDTAALRTRLTVFYDSLAAVTARIKAVDQAGVTTLRDSVRAHVDSLAALHAFARADSARLDSLVHFTLLDTVPGANRAGTGFYLFGRAADTTSPGKFYKIKPDSTWSRADTSISVSAAGVAMDSVNKGAVCRFLIGGTYRNDAWHWTPGLDVFSHATIAGEADTAHVAVPGKQQKYGKVLRSNVILVNIDGTIAY